MLTTEQKETILRKAGVAVPVCPVGGSAVPQQVQVTPPLEEGLSAGKREAIDQWTRTIDTLFVEYSAARAARSLRHAEEARIRDALRQASEGPPAC